MNRRELLKRFGQGCAAAVAAVVGVRVKPPVSPTQAGVWTCKVLPPIQCHRPVELRNYVSTYTYVTKEEVVEKMRLAMKNTKFQGPSNPIRFDPVSAELEQRIEEGLS